MQFAKDKPTVRCRNQEDQQEEQKCKTMGCPYAITWGTKEGLHHCCRRCPESGKHGKKCEKVFYRHQRDDLPDADVPVCTKDGDYDHLGRWCPAKRMARRPLENDGKYGSSKIKKDEEHGPIDADTRPQPAPVPKPPAHPPPAADTRLQPPPAPRPPAHPPPAQIRWNHDKTKKRKYNVWDHDMTENTSIYARGVHIAKAASEKQDNDKYDSRNCKSRDAPWRHYSRRHHDQDREQISDNHDKYADAPWRQRDQDEEKDYDDHGKEHDDYDEQDTQQDYWYWSISDDTPCRQPEQDEEPDDFSMYDDTPCQQPEQDKGHGTGECDTYDDTPWRPGEHDPDEYVPRNGSPSPDSEADFCQDAGANPWFKRRTRNEETEYAPAAETNGKGEAEPLIDHKASHKSDESTDAGYSGPFPS